VPSILENDAFHRSEKKPTVTYINCVNGSLSVIQSYQQRVARRKGGRQMQLYSPLPEEGLFEVGDQTLFHQTIHHFDSEAIREALLERNRINVLSVMLTHNNEADGLGLGAVPGWQRPDREHGATWA